MRKLADTPIADLSFPLLPSMNKFLAIRFPSIRIIRLQWSFLGFLFYHIAILSLDLALPLWRLCYNVIVDFVCDISIANKISKFRSPSRKMLKSD